MYGIQAPRFLSSFIHLEEKIAFKQISARVTWINKNSPFRLFSTTPKTTEVSYRILSTDGGGIRGIIPGMVMKYMEEYTGLPLHKLFDGIAGTSTGGILGLSSSTPSLTDNKKNRYSASSNLSLYVDPHMSRKIFSPSQPDSSPNSKKQNRVNLLSVSFGSDSHSSSPRFDTDLPGLRKLVRTQYSTDSLESILRERFGNLTLKDTLTDMLITTVDIRTRIPKIFTRALARENSNENHLVWEVARMTSAAPTYFDPFTFNLMKFVDGGLVANNPTLCMILDAKRRRIPFSKMLCVSLGTGEYAPPLNTHGYGQIQFAPLVFDVMSSAAATLVHHQARDLLKDRYYRFQIELDQNISLDDASETNIQLLQEMGAKLIRNHREKIEEACDKLKEIGKRQDKI